MHGFRKLKHGCMILGVGDAAQAIWFRESRDVQCIFKTTCRVESSECCKKAEGWS